MGLTGEIKFDVLGFRTSFHLDLVEKVIHSLLVIHDVDKWANERVSFIPIQNLGTRPDEEDCQLGHRHWAELHFV